MVQLELNYSQVTAILPKSRANNIIHSAIPELINHAVIIPTRGTLVQEKWIQRFYPTLSPEQFIVELVVPNSYIDAVMHNIIVEGDLYHSGAGGIYSISCQGAYFSKPLDNKIKIQKLEEKAFQLKNDLVTIFCIVQKGKSEPILTAAMQEGSPGPSVGYGEGHGVRDKMGIWRFAINPEKELIRVVVDSYDFEAVYAAMISAGKLDIPGMGFIYAIQVSKGLMNIASIYGSKTQLASTHQIIKAIDDLNKGTQWRSQTFLQQNFNERKTKDKTSLSMSKLTFVVDHSYTETFVKGILNAGVPGLSVNYGREFIEEPNKTSTGIQLSKDLAMIEMIMPLNSQNKIISELVSLAKKEKVDDYNFFTQNVSSTLAYSE